MAGLIRTVSMEYLKMPYQSCSSSKFGETDAEINFDLSCLLDKNTENHHIQTLDT